VLNVISLFLRFFEIYNGMSVFFESNQSYHLKMVSRNTIESAILKTEQILLEIKNLFDEPSNRI